jgi:hypothetical protein
LPELNNELPVEHADPIIDLFTETIHGLHLSTTRPMVYPDSPRRGNQVADIPFEDQVGLLQEKLLQQLKHVNHREYPHIFQSIMETVIQKTRFGDRFLIRPEYSVACALPLDFCSLPVPKTSLIEVLNGVFGVPSLFFGGAPLPKQAMIPKLLQLPHYLVFLFLRFNGKELNTTTLEITMDIDMGKFMDPKALKPSVAHGYRGSPTLYRLHGFITQKDGMYMTYSRVRSGQRWFRLQDHTVEPVELGVSIESKGIVLALFRLQDF